MKRQSWTRDLMFLAATVLFVRLAQGFQSGVSTNFFVHELGLGGDRVLWLTGIREIPGLLLVFLAALMLKLPLSSRGAISILLMGLGYGAYALVNSYLALIVAAVVSSIGFHNWMPLQSSLGMALVRKEESGRVMGWLNGIGALGSLGGMLLISLTVNRLGLRSFYVLAGVAFAIGVVLVLQIDKKVGAEAELERRSKIVFRKRYWLYYVLIFFEGSRTQVFFAFASWVLVDAYGMSAQVLPIVLIASGLVNLVGSPRMGAWIDRYGERRVLLGSYLGLVLCFIGYATLQQVWFLAALYVLINFFVISRVALSTYVNRIALPGDLVPTLSAGVSVNHITSVAMSLLAGTLLRLVGYQTLCWAAAGMILLSCPFAWMVRSDPVLPEMDPATVA